MHQTDVHLVAAKALAAEHWSADPDSLLAEEVTGYLPWCRYHRAVLVADASGARLLVTSYPEQEAEIWGDPELPADLDRVNGFMARDGWTLPSSPPPEVTAAGLRLLLAGFGGHVATREFCENQPPDWRGWSRGGDIKPPAFFEAHCYDPWIESTPTGWRLDFRFFNDRGGVEHWRIEGTGNRVLGADRTYTVPDGTLSYPYG